MFTDNQCDLLFLGAKSEAKEARIPIYRNFIFGLALAEQCGVSYADMAWSLYNFTHRATPMHSARPKIKILYTAFFSDKIVTISLGRNVAHCVSAPKQTALIYPT